MVLRELIFNCFYFGGFGGLESRTVSTGRFGHCF